MQKKQTLVVKQAVVYYEACDQSKQTEQSNSFAMGTVRHLFCAAPQRLWTGAGQAHAPAQTLMLMASSLAKPSSAYIQPEYAPWQKMPVPHAPPCTGRQRMKVPKYE